MTKWETIKRNKCRSLRASSCSSHVEQRAVKPQTLNTGLYMFELLAHVSSHYLHFVISSKSLLFKKKPFLPLYSQNYK